MPSDLEKAKQAIQQEVDTIHNFLLGKLADIAADMGDEELEMGYRWLAANNKWPSPYTPVDDIGNPTSQPEWGWHGSQWSNIHIWGHEFYDGCIGDYYNLTEDGWYSPHEALEIAAKTIGKELKKLETEGNTNEG